MLALAGLITCYWVGTTMIRPLVAPYTAGLGAGGLQVAAVLAAQAVPAAVLAVPAGLVADRLGHRRLVALGSVVTVVGGLLLAAPGGIPAIVLGQAVIGAGGVAVWLGVQGWMIARAPGDTDADRDRRMSNWSVVVLVGQLAGPVVGGLLADLTGYRGAFFAFAAIALVGVVCARGMAELPRPAPADGEASVSVRGLLGSYRTAASLTRSPGMVLTLLVSFCAAGLLDLRTAFQPLYFHTLGLTPTVIGVVLSCGTAAGVVSRAALVPLLRRCRIGTVAVLTLVPGAAAVGGVAFVEDLWAVFLLAGVAGLSLGMAQPLTLRLTADVTDPRHHGVAIGLRLVANRTARWLDPLFFGAVLAVTSLPVALVCTALLVTGAALVAGRGLNRLPGADPRPGGPAAS